TFVILAFAPTMLGVDRKSEAAAAGEKIKASDGMKFIFQNRYLRALAILISAFLFAAGTLSIANLFLLTKVLHASVFIYGLSGAASALGMIMGGVLLMQITIQVSQQPKAIAIVLGGTALCIIGMSFAGHWSIVLILDLFLGILISILTNLISTIFIQRSPSDMRGRIGAALNAFINLGMIGALLISGPLIDWLGTRKLLLVAGLAALVILAVFGPAIFHDEVPASEE
ncbi:MAG: MFS transporter, partial [Actinomycetes bacterium]